MGLARSAPSFVKYANEGGTPRFTWTNPPIPMVMFSDPARLLKKVLSSGMRLIVVTLERSELKP
jgi:hypothetical protein